MKPFQSLDVGRVLVSPIKNPAQCPVIDGDILYGFNGSTITGSEIQELVVLLIGYMKAYAGHDCACNVQIDSEVFQISEYKDVQVFVAKIDTKPYERIYTKFDKNKFRYFERKDDDQS